MGLVVQRVEMGRAKMGGFGAMPKPIDSLAAISSWCFHIQMFKFKCSKSMLSCTFGRWIVSSARCDWRAPQVPTCPAAL